MTRGLPVLDHCGQCADASDDPVACVHHAIGNRALPDLVSAPPDWCPLPRAEPDRELLAAAIRKAWKAGMRSSTGDGAHETDVNAIIDAILAARSQR